MLFFSFFAALIFTLAILSVDGESTHSPVATKRQTGHHPVHRETTKKHGTVTTAPKKGGATQNSPIAASLMLLSAVAIRAL